LFTNAFRIDKNANRKSLKLEDEKNVLSKIYNSVKSVKKKSGGVLDSTSLEQLDEMWRKKDAEEKAKLRTTLSPSKRDGSDNNNNDDKNAEDELINPRVLKRKDSLVSLPNYAIRKPERKHTSTTEVLETTTVNIIYRNKRANSDKTEVVRKMEQLNRSNSNHLHFERERSQLIPVVSSRLPSSILPALVMETKRPRPSSPTSPTMMSRHNVKSPPQKSRTPTLTRAATDLQKMKDVVADSGF